jgi:hypothetical protein
MQLPPRWQEDQMGLQADHQQEGEQSVLELARPHSGKGWSGVVIGNDQPAPDRDNDSIRARAPAPQVPPGKRRSVEVPPPKKHPQESKPPPTEQDREVGDRSRIARWRRHPFLFVIGFFLFLVAVAEEIRAGTPCSAPSRGLLAQAR